MCESHADRPRTSSNVESAGGHCSCFLRRLQILIAVALLVCSWPQQGALAKVYPPVGDHGDVQLKQPDLCPTGSFLTGLRVRVGEWMDQLAIVCGHLDSNGNVTGPPWVSPNAYGGPGGGLVVPDVTCNANEIMTGVAFLFTPGREVRLLSFHCVPMKPGGAAHDVIIGNKTHGGPSNVRQDCQPSEAINGLMVNYGKYVNGVGIACAEKPNMAPPPAPSTATLAPGQTQQGPFGGPGGGPFQITCNSGDQVVGFDTMQQNGVLVGIAPVCAHRQTSPTDTYGRPSVGTSTGTWNRLRCEPSAVVTILDAYVGNLPFVSTIGFTCWNPKTNKPTNSYPDAGSPKVSHQNLVCPSGQIAVGIYGRAGTAIDQVGVICGQWVAAAPSPIATQPLPPLPPGLTQDQQDIFAVQDSYRQACGVPQLTWDPALAAAAASWIKSCPKAKDSSGNEFACHENDSNPACPNGGRFPSPYGENLSFGSPTMPGKNAALAWICEWKNYMVNGAPPSTPTFVGGNYTSTPTDPCPLVNGHFTEVVWQPPVPPGLVGSIGCASNACTINGQSGTLWSCKYNPPGNFNVVPGPGLTAAQASANLKANVPSTCPAPPPMPASQQHH